MAGCREGHRKKPTAAPPRRERTGLQRKGSACGGQGHEGHRQILTGDRIPVGSSVHARGLKNLILRGTRQLSPSSLFCLIYGEHREEASCMVLGRARWLQWRLEQAVCCDRGGEETPVTNKYWKSALAPWIAEVHAAQINANLLTANERIKWKLLKKSILKK